MRVHGTHACRPVELFNLEEKPRLGLAPSSRYDLPTYGSAKVHRDLRIPLIRYIESGVFVRGGRRPRSADARFGVSPWLTSSLMVFGSLSGLGSARAGLVFVGADLP